MIELIESLRSHGVEFLIVGAHALGHHARPRFTEDLDVYIRRGQVNVDTLDQALKDFGFALAQDALIVLRESDRGFIALGRKPNRVDLLNFLDGVDFDHAWHRRSPGKLAGVAVDYLSLEDYIATKKASGRPKDRSDLDLLREAIGPLPGDEF